MCPTIISAALGGGSAAATASTASTAAITMQAISLAVGLASASASTAMGVKAQKTQGSRARAAQEHATKQAELEAQGIAEQQIGIADAAAAKRERLNLQAESALARHRVGAGEAGAAGLTIDRLAVEIEQDRLRGIDVIDTNLHSAHRGAARAAEAVGTRRDGFIGSLDFGNPGAAGAVGAIDIINAGVAGLLDPIGDTNLTLLDV